MGSVVSRSHGTSFSSSRLSLVSLTLLEGADRWAAKSSLSLLSPIARDFLFPTKERAWAIGFRRRRPRPRPRPHPRPNSRQDPFQNHALRLLALVTASDQREAVDPSYRASSSRTRPLPPPMTQAPVHLHVPLAQLSHGRAPPRAGLE
jgi:hypothetical protein